MGVRAWEVERRLGSAKRPALDSGRQPSLTLVDGGRQFRYNQATGLQVDERKLAVSGLVRDFRAGNIDTIVTIKSGKPGSSYKNEHVSGQATTGTDVVVGIVQNMLPTVDTGWLRDETQRHEYAFLERGIDGAQLMKQDTIHRTDLMTGLQAFEEVLTNHHGPMYMDACRHFHHFGAYLVVQASS